MSVVGVAIIAVTTNCIEANRRELDVDGDAAGSCVLDEDCAAPGDRCAGRPRCVERVCEPGEPVVCAALGEACRDNVCDPTSGECFAEALPSSVSCDDHDACTREDRCGEVGTADAGTCVGRDRVACVAAGDCGEIGTCNPLSGVCDAPLKPDGALCEDAVAPSGVGSAAGVCASGACRRLPVIALGSAHGCAVLWDGGMRCWGRNDAGQLGLGDTRDVGDGRGPSVAEAGALPLPAVSAIGLGLSQTCAVTDRTLKCWGSNSSGALGYGDLTTRGTTAETTPEHLEPLALGPGFVPRLAAPGLFASCAVSVEGAVKCWGTVDLGYADVDAVGVPNAIPIAEAGVVRLAPEGEGFAVDALVRTSTHACALAQGRVRCWGDPALLGIGASEHVGDDEAPGDLPVVNPGWSARALSASDRHTCAVSEAGDVYCWGDNGAGQIGNGTNAPAPGVFGPVFLGGGRHARAVAAGRRHTCVLLDDARVRCWGDNSRGQLGRGDVAPQLLVPSGASEVALGGAVAAIAAGWDFTCAVMRDGDVRCFGEGANGRLGDEADAVVGDEAVEMPPRAIVFE